MNAELHRRASELFHEACELPPEERARWLASLRAREPELAQLVAELLDQDARTSELLDRPAVAGVAHELVGDAFEAADPSHVGRYRILARLGHGGMGVVYEAEQDQPRRRVALKLVKRDRLDSQQLKRFQREAELLGRLAHPGIAQIHEAGAALVDGVQQPYFAMELVRGETLIEHSKRVALGVAQRLELIATVADAIEHAHRNGVIHRDLKPSNVLVDERGVAKVLDFGVARISGDERGVTKVTLAGELVGTLAYMSPEQLQGADIDARADVYALGVIAYEMLAGRRPHEVAHLALHEAARVISEVDPAPLGVLDRDLRGDVETIVAKALEKDPRRRYGSAKELAADIRRFLADEPIVARAPTAAYQLAKFARRHKALVGGALATLVVAAIGVVVALQFHFATERARSDELAMRERAQREADTLADVKDYFARFLVSPSPWAQGANVTVSDALAHMSAEIEAAFPGQPLQQAWLCKTIGDSYVQLGRFEDAQESLERALQLLADSKSDDARLISEVEQLLANVLVELGFSQRAHELAAKALAGQARCVPPPSPWERAMAHMALAKALLALDRIPEADEAAQTAAAQLSQGAPPPLTESAVMLQQLAHIAAAAGRYADAEQLARRSIEQFDTLDVGDRMDVILAFNTLGDALDRQGRAEEAAEWLQRALDSVLRIAGASHPLAHSISGNLAVVLAHAGRLAEAEPLMRAGVEAQRLRDGSNPVLAHSLSNFGELLRKLGRLDEALEVLHEAEAMAAATAGDASALRSNSLVFLGRTLRDKGELTPALAAFEEGAQIRSDALGPDHPRAIEARQELEALDALLSAH